MDIKVVATLTATNNLDCMSVPQLQQATAQDDHLQQLKGYIITGWPENTDQMLQDMRTYCTFQDDMVVINGIIMKGRCVVIPEALKNTGTRSTPGQPHGNRKTKLEACESVYWVNINDDIEKHIKICTTCLTFK